MRHRLFTILSGLSLVLCVAVVGLWVRSYWREDEAGYELSTSPLVVTHTAGFESERGHIWIGRKRRERDDGRRGFYWEVDEPNVRGDDWRTFSIDWEGMDDWGDWGVGVPHWTLALVAAAPPAVWLFRARRKRHRSRSGLCPACGYDLRATPGRCPECGREAGAAGEDPATDEHRSE